MAASTRVAREAAGVDTDTPPTVEALFVAHRARLLRLATLLVDDQGTAEDVVQEAFAGPHRHWGSLRTESSSAAYLQTAVVNGSRSVLRRRRTAREHPPPQEVAHESAEDVAALGAEHADVLRALAQIAPRQREVLVLRYWAGLSETEIAEALHVSRGSVKSTAKPGARRPGGAS